MRAGFGIAMAFILVVSRSMLGAADDKAPLPAPADRKIDFAKDVEPIFAKNCLECHGEKKQRSDLRLDSRAATLQGGTEGPSLVPGKSAESLLIRLVSGMDKDRVMPPKGDRLSDREIGVLRAWIDQGAEWSGSQAVQKKETEATWWSLKPLARPEVPKVADERFPIRNPIDAFVLAKLREKSLDPSNQADRRTLIRRVYFDLIGLPPTAKEVEAFVNDPSPSAYEDLVDRLLASDAYGERWARHWLDIVHFGETHGYDKDQPRPHAWPYRDYVIRAFNSDRPFDRFLQEQIAGDVLFPGTVDGIEALGFLSAGPWDFIGHAEVGEERIDGKITRHLDRDDMVSNTIGTFNSMTIGCAQCHNHKFDPIPMEDYYSLHAVFSAIDRTNRRYYADPALMKQRDALDQRLRTLDKEAKALQAKMKSRGGSELAELDRKIADASRPKNGPQHVEFGYHSGLAAKEDMTKWVQIDLEKPEAIREVVVHPTWDDFGSIGPGFGFPVRFKIEVSDDAKFEKGVEILVDRTKADVPNPGTEPQSAKVAVKARYVRFTATKLARRVDAFILALAEMSVHDAAGKNLAAGKPVTALDSVEVGPRWAKKNLVDGLANRVASARPDELAKLTEARNALIAKLADPKLAADLEATEKAIADTKKDIGKMPPGQLAYVGAVHFGSGAFRGTGDMGGKPRPIRVLPRGDVRKPGKEVGPGALSALGHQPARFELPAEHAEGDRRAALAKWLSDKNNPLTWRSIVNRVWLYHMGRGIVDSPNDFGKMGQLPSHPELLDWLAAEFRDGGQSFKKLHKLIVTSSTYRQASADRPEPMKVDSGNQYYWKANRRRLEAEAIRDSVLLVSGKLNRKMGGPSFQDFVVKHPEHSPHYKYELHDPEDPASHRRSIYRFIVRSQQQPFLATLDCADPSLNVEKRNQTITPQQALAMLNNQLVLAMSRHFATRVRTEEPDEAKQPIAAFRIAVGRDPTTTEAETLTRYAKEHGLPNLCRVVMNLNEFVFVD
jgi:cytochrome c553